MTDREYYRSTFSQIRSARRICWEECETMKTKQTKHRRPGRVTALALAAALMAALSATALALNLFGLRDVLLPQKQPVGKLDENGILIPGETELVDMISLSGYTDSPESLALEEWTAFLNSYDVEGAAAEADRYWKEHGRGDPALDKYDGYSVFNEEMAARLEEILSRYGLALHGPVRLLGSREELTGFAGGDFLGPARAGSGYCYDNGTLAFDGELDRPDGNGVLDFQFRRSVKGWFDEVLLNVGDAASYDQWNYRTAGGEEVLLCLGPSKGLVLAGFEDCFVTLNLLSGAREGWLGGPAVGPGDLEALADSIDFTLLHPVKGGSGEPDATLALPPVLLPLLLGEEGAVFLDGETGEDMPLEEYAARRAPEEGEPIQFCGIIPVDLDGDGTNEAVLREQWGENDAFGWLVLRLQGDTVFGYPREYRTLLDLKADGTYGLSGGAGDFSVVRAGFNSVAQLTEDVEAAQVWRDNGEEHTASCYIRGEEVPWDTYDSWMTEWESREPARELVLSGKDRETTLRQLFGRE